MASTASFAVDDRVFYKGEPGMTGTVVEVVMVEKNRAKTTSRYESGIVGLVPMYKVRWDSGLVQDTSYWPTELKKLRVSTGR